MTQRKIDCPSFGARIKLARAVLAEGIEERRKAGNSGLFRTAKNLLAIVPDILGLKTKPREIHIFLAQRLTSYLDTAAPRSLADNISRRNIKERLLTNLELQAMLPGYRRWILGETNMLGREVLTLEDKVRIIASETTGTWRFETNNRQLAVFLNNDAENNKISVDAQDQTTNTRVLVELDHADQVKGSYQQLPLDESRQFPLSRANFSFILGEHGVSIESTIPRAIAMNSQMMREYIHFLINKPFSILWGE